MRRMPAALIAACLSGCQHETCPAAGVEAAVVTVVDAFSGAPVCDATLVAVAGSQRVALSACARADASCAYCMSGGGGVTYEIEVQAPGYEPSRTLLTVSVDACDLVETTVTATVRLSCAAPFVHDDGLGQRWRDCVPTGTLTEREAATACASFVGDAGGCGPTACAYSDASAVCSTRASATGPCACWTYAGPGAGLVNASSAGCACPVSALTGWN